MSSPHHHDGVILCTSSSKSLPLVENFKHLVNHDLLLDTVTYHPNKEIKATISESIRNKRVYILGFFGQLNEQCTPSINDSIMEIMVLVDACKRSDVYSICLIMPYFPYCRSDKKDDGRCAISAAMVTNMFEKAGVKRFVALDLHSAQIQGFPKNAPFDNLYAINLFCSFLKENGLNDNKQYVLVSPDQGGAKRARIYASRLNMDVCTMDKTRKVKEGVNGVQKISLLTEGTVEGKVAILIDDMVDTCGTMVTACDFLKTRGIVSVIILASHGVLSGPAVDRINACDFIQKVIVTDSIPQSENQKRCSKLQVISILPLLANVIQRLYHGASISALFLP